jgi:hypothetical protein
LYNWRCLDSSSWRLLDFRHTPISHCRRLHFILLHRFLCGEFTQYHPNTWLSAYECNRQSFADCFNILFTLFLGVQTYLTLVVPESAVATYYVCFAEDPATLKKSDEPLYQYMSVRQQQLEQEIE